MQEKKYNGWIRYTELEENPTKTLGQLSLEQEKNRKDNTHTVKEQVEANLREYVPSILKTVEKGKKHFNDDFFVEILFVNNRLIEENQKIIAAARKTCPSPDYERGVYKYHKKDDRLEYLWVIPGVELCKELLSPSYIPVIGEDDLYKNVKDFFNGKLELRSKTENSKIYGTKGYVAGSNLIIN